MQAIQDDETAIRQLVATWLSASKQKNTNKVLSLMAEDVVFLTPGHPPMRGKSAFAEAQQQLQQIDVDAQGEIQEIKVFGEWAYVWTALSVVLMPRSGEVITRSGHTLSILQKQAGVWFLYRDANMLAPVGR